MLVFTHFSRFSNENLNAAELHHETITLLLKKDIFLAFLDILGTKKLYFTIFIEQTFNLRESFLLLIVK